MRRLVPLVAVAALAPAVAPAPASAFSLLGALRFPFWSALPAAPPPAPAASVGVQIGARLIVAVDGGWPSPSLLARARRGEIGGILLFGDDVVDRGALRQRIGRLQAAARAGGQPPLLVTIDQEGGAVRRLPDLPPRLSARALGEAGPAALRREGVATGDALRALGINVDLAPVVDAPANAGRVLWRQGRAWSLDPGEIKNRAPLFAAGLQSAGVLATAKHFPGLGRADITTDTAPVTIGATRAELDRRDLVPFRHMIDDGVALVMLSSATYPALDDAPAVWSRRVAVGLLRDELGFRGASMSDALDAIAATRRVRLGDATARAARAGVDFLLLTGSEEGSASVYRDLVRRARAGALSPASVRASYDRVVAARRNAG